MSSITPIKLADEKGAAQYYAAPAEGLVRATARYMLRTEVHTFAFSVAANAILSFFPFLLVLMTLIRYVFHSHVMYSVVENLLRDYVPTGQEFVIRNLNVLVGTHHQAKVFSLAMLLITSTGIFLPLEVALNRIWGFRKEPLLPGKSVNVARIGVCLRIACAGIGWIDSREFRHFAACPARPWRLVHPDGGFYDHEDLRHRRQHRHLLSRLLAFAERQGSGSSSSAGSRDHGIAFRGAEIRLHLRATAPEFRGNIWPVRHLRQLDVLGISVRNASADWSSSLGAKNNAALKLRA